MALQTTFLPDVPPRASCDRCGRRLYDPVSRALGTGPVCRRYVTITRETRVETTETIAREIPETESPTFFTWYDPSKYGDLGDKAVDGIDRFKQRHGCEPAVILVRPADAEDLALMLWERGRARIEVRAADVVPVHCFYIGMESGGIGTPLVIETEGR